MSTSLMGPKQTRIPVRSRRQAMEWSLVLSSQGIANSVEFSHEPGEGWGLFVDAADVPRALSNLRQYKAENRDRSWRASLRMPEFAFHWGCLLWVLLLAIVHRFAAAHPGFVDAAMMNKTAFLHGEWWRLFTAMLLHADVAHLATNLSLGVVLLGLVMGRFGGGIGLLAAYLAGAAGNLAFLVHSAYARGLGSSGMIMGALGLLAMQTVSPVRPVRLPFRRWLGGLAAAIMLFVLLGLSPESDTAVHLGGFLAGVFLGAGLAFVPARILHNFKWNLAATLSLLALVFLTISRAIH